MAAATKKSKAAVQYAQAVLDLATGLNATEAFGSELAQINELVEQNPTFSLLLRDPAIGEEERHRVLEKVFKGRVSPLAYNLLGVLNKKGRLAILGQITQTYQRLLDAHLGKIGVDVTVAQRLDDAALAEVRKGISAALKKDAIVQQHVDESIIGGMVVRVEDKLIDGSVRAQLEAMRSQLLAAAPR